MAASSSQVYRASSDAMAPGDRLPGRPRYFLCDTGCGRLLIVEAASATPARNEARRVVAEALRTAQSWARVIAALPGPAAGAQVPAAASERADADNQRLAEALVTLVSGPLDLGAARRAQRTWDSGDRLAVLLEHARKSVRARYDLRYVFPDGIPATRVPWWRRS